ncbi:MAG: insulinase family protein [Clostridia bacterium]|nr:insulinase family protein [Clostridia bacterium]
MEINEKRYGFAVKEIHDLAGLSATLTVMEHEGTGARLVYLDRDDENKTFSVAFKTLPTDSTGVFHILEHSVLCGSQKYRLKDPFVELLKGSLNTFLNAMTFGDKTMYPVASTNEKEFLSLASVYLDAVFNPLAVEDSLAFLQEGWHYEIDDEGGLTYKGVVLNEMRGDYSSPESVTDRHISEMLFDGTCYSHDSGGDPENITDLTYEQFCEEHRACYHPSNATFFLDGSLDIDKALALISGYIDGYGRAELDEKKFSFKNVKRRVERREAEYEISDSESEKNKSRLALAHLTFRFDERYKIFGAAVLSSALFSSNESEIKKKMLASGLCEDMQVNIGEGIYENYFEVDFINVKDGGEGELEALFYDSVRKVCESKIPREELLAAINSIEFTQRERDYGTLPLGVVYAMNLMETYLYSDDAVSGLSFENEIKYIRDNIDSGFFERLLSEIFIENESRAALLLRPSKTLGERQRNKEKERLSDILKAMSEDERARIKSECERLLAWQNADESDAARDSIPRLSVADIEREVKSIPTSTSEYDGATLLTHRIATNKISYAELHFDLSDIERDEIFTAALLSLFLGNLETESYSARQLIRELKSELGGFTSTLKPITRVDGTVKVYFKVAVSMLSSKKEKATELIRQILKTTRFEDSDAMENSVKQAYIACEEGFSSHGHRVAKGRAAAMLFTEAAVTEYHSGFEAYLSYKRLSENFGEEFPALKERLYAFVDKYFTRDRLTVSVAEDCDNTDFLGNVAEIFDKSDFNGCVCTISPLEKRREGIKIPAKVGFASAVAYAEPDSMADFGVRCVASNLVSYEYLWSEIRVKGGAYGAGMSSLRTGQSSFYSYRDPSPHKSLERMINAADFLIDSVEGGADIEKYIIGAIGDSSPYLTPRARGSIGTQRYLSLLTDEMRRELREGILTADSEGIRKFAQKLKAAMGSAAYCIVAPEDKLNGAGLDAVLEI